MFLFCIILGNVKNVMDSKLYFGKNKISYSLLVILLMGVLHPSQLFSQAPQAQFNSNKVSGCVPLVVQFFDQSTNSPTSWLWDFGNGNSSSVQQNPSAIYSLPGTYTVKLKVANGNGVDSITIINYITVFGKPQSNFSSPDTAGCSPHMATFTDLSTPGILANSIVSWDWNFGDGSPNSSDPNPQHIYTLNGNRNVSLRVTNDKGCIETFGRSQYIKVGVGIDASFADSSVAGCALPVQSFFTNTSQGNIAGANFTWNFGDNTPIVTNNNTVVPHNYTTTGFFDVTLIASNNVGCRDTFTKRVISTAYLTNVSGPDTICKNLIANYSFTTNSSPVSVKWTNSFNNSQTVGNTYSFTFTTPGTYEVALIINYGACADTIRKSIVVKDVPVANFTFSDSVNCNVPFSVNFTNTSTGATTYSWAFGPVNAVSQAINPSYNYTSLGQYSVTLTATAGTGCTNTITKTNIIKLQKPTVSISSGGGGCAPYSYSATAVPSAPDGIYRYHWNFGNTAATNDTANTLSASYIYTNPGTYTVSLTAYSNTGCVATATKTIIVGEPVTFDLTISQPQNCVKRNVTFNIINRVGGAAPFTYSWNFGDGRPAVTTSVPTITTQFSTTGTYIVSASVTTTTCTQTDTISVSITPPTARLGVSKLLSCLSPDNLTVNFKDSSIGATGVAWTFGAVASPLFTSTSTTPTVTFPTAGTYPVRLISYLDQSNPSACADTVTTSITVVNRGVTLGFTGGRDTFCRLTPFSMIATHASPSFITGYIWNYGDGSPSFNGNAAVNNNIFSTMGLYNISVAATDVWGCRDVVSRLIKIAGPTASFTNTPSGGCLNSTINVNSTTSLFSTPLNLWTWNFGDGSGNQTFTSNADNYAHQYDSAGTFSITLTVRDLNGCTNSITRANVVTIGNVKADFLSIDSFSCPNAAVRFTDSSKGFVSSRLWTITDVNNNVIATYNTPNPQHAFLDSGLYTVKLKVRASSGCEDSITKTNYITIKSPKASFSISDSSTTCPPLQVNFTDSSYYVNKWSWDFKDGGISFSQSPVNVYLIPGVYKAKLTATSPGGCIDSAFRTISIGGPFGTFGYGPPTVGCNPLTVNNFTVNTTGSIDFTWDFGDGTVINTGLDSTTSYTYTSGGDFIPRVLVQDAVGCIVPIPGLDTIHVEYARVYFQANKKLLCDSGTVAFRDSVITNSSSLTYFWDFGDGQTSTAKTPNHFYASTGNYTVKLKVTTNASCPDSTEYTDFISVVNSPKPSISIIDSILCRPANFTFSSNVLPDTATITNWSWTFGNGNTSNLQNPVPQLFANSGTFSNSLTVTNASGCITTINKSIFLPSDDSLQVKFGAAPLVLCDSGMVNFRDSSIIKVPGVISYVWNFGNGDTSHAINPSYFYHSTGTYNVKLNINTTKNCKDSITYNALIKVVKSPIAIINLTDSVLCKPASFVFTGSQQQPDTSAIAYWEWSFGNSNTSVSQNPPAQIFNNSGTFINRLAIINSSGCVDTAFRTVVVPFTDSLKAGFRVNKSVFCDSATISFTDTSKKSIPGSFIYEWNFGDNSPVSNSINPTHFYGIPGAYTVKLKIISSIGCVDSVVKTNFIQVVQPKPSIGLQDTVQCIPARFTFTGSVVPDTFAITSWNWTFGNGATSNVQNPPLQVFSTSGLFNNTLTVTNSFGCSFSVTKQSKVLSNDSLVVNFGSDKVRICDAGLIQFSDSTLVNIPGTISYQWNFGDLSPINTSQNPSHTYTATGLYDVKLKVTSTIPGCSDSLTIPGMIGIVKSPIPSITINSNDSLCYPASFTFLGNVAADTSLITSWSWQFGNSNTATVQYPTSETFLTVGTSANTLTVVNSTGCVGTVSKDATVMPLPSFILSADTTICRGDTIALNISGASAYSWSPSVGLSSTFIANPNAFPVTNQQYVVTGTSTFGCIEDTAILIKVFQPYVLSTSQILDSICLGNSTQLFATGAPNYSWTPVNAGLSNENIANPIATPLTTTTYTVLGYDSLACFNQSINVTVRVFDYPTISLGPDLVMSAGATRLLTPTYSNDIVSYSWTPPTNLSCTNCPNPIVTAFSNISYFATVTNNGGCTTSDTIRVLVTCDNSNVFIPNTFSPNNDGINDVFMVRGTGVYAVNSIRIFNRVGQMIFEKRNVMANNPSDGWDGKINGMKPASDAYVYVVEVTCSTGQILKYTGTITLVN